MKNTCRNLVFYFKGFFFFFTVSENGMRSLFHQKSTALGSLKVNLILLKSDFHYKEKGSGGFSKGTEEQEIPTR